jgi:hypothetical protein
MWKLGYGVGQTDLVVKVKDECSCGDAEVLDPRHNLKVVQTGPPVRLDVRQWEDVPLGLT